MLSPCNQHGGSSNAHYLLSQGQVWEEIFSAHKCWEQHMLSLSATADRLWSLFSARAKVISSRESCSLADQFEQVPYCQANRTEVSSSMGRRKLESCTLSARALTSPRTPLLRKAQTQKLAPFPAQLHPVGHIPQFLVLLILQLLQALKLLKKTTTKALCGGRQN